MAQELHEGDGKAGIARAGKRKWGYDPAQVDAFLDRAHALYDSEDIKLTQRDIQNVSFDLVKDGYVIAQVDATLGRLERAVVDKQTAWEIAQHGRVTWKAQTENLYHEILNHVEREPHQRFKPGEPKQPSYDRKQVDRLTDQIVDKAAAALGVDGVSEDDVRDLADLNANSVSSVIFTQRKGKKGYDERQVDYFLNSCVQLLSRLESYARVGDYVSGAGAAAAAPAAAPIADAPAAAPAPALFPANTAVPTPDAQPAPATPESDESFDALHQAERSLFSAPAPELAEVQPVSFPPAPVAPPAAPAPQPPVHSAPTAAPAYAPVDSAPAAPAVPQAADHPADSSLAALAHMAEISQDMPVVDVRSFAPKMPSLDTPTELKLSDMPDSIVPVSTPSAPAPPPVQTAAAPAAPAMLGEAPRSAQSNDMPVSFAPATKLERTPAPAPQPNAEQQAPAGAETAAKPKQQTPDISFPSFFLTGGGFDTDIPDLSFPVLNDDNTKKEQ